VGASHFFTAGKYKSFSDRLTRFIFLSVTLCVFTPAISVVTAWLNPFAAEKYKMLSQRLAENLFLCVTQCVFTPAFSVVAPVAPVKRIIVMKATLAAR
jgi:hypothetical protein